MVLFALNGVMLVAGLLAARPRMLPAGPEEQGAEGQAAEAGEAPRDLPCPADFPALYRKLAA